MQKSVSTLLFFALLPVLGNAQTFQDFLNRVNAAPSLERTAIVDSFMNAVGSLPLREGETVCHFIYRGAANGVNAPGDANNWNASAFPLTRLSTTDLWYRTQIFEPDARLDYKFVLNGSTWILDPRNPLTVSGGFGPNSELRMPAYSAAPEILYYPGIPHGTLRDTTYFSTNLGNSRTIRIYTPPGYESSTDSFGVILFHDGIEYTTLAQANNVIDYLISQNRIRPIIGVFVPPLNRTAEYRTTQINGFSSFIVNEIIPYIDARYRTRRSPDNRAVLGASDGGNITLWLGLNYSGVFGNVAAQSSNIVSAISSGFQNGPQLNLKLYLDLGTYDIPQLIPLVRSFIPILQARGYTYQYHEYHEGHSWGNWRAHIANALEMFFAPTSVTVKETGEVPQATALEQNYPNPFNPTTTIRFRLTTDSFVHLSVYDLLGREVATLVNERLNAGSFSTEWNAAIQPSGTYFYRLQANEYVATKKLILIR
jgi:enterochelin esterase-like enzyme